MEEVLLLDELRVELEEEVRVELEEARVEELVLTGRALELEVTVPV